MVNSSARSINILNLAFALSIIIVLAVNIAVLAYAFASIKFISDMNLPINIGRAGENFQRLAIYAQVQIMLPYLHIENGDKEVKASNEKFAKALSDLEQIYANIISSYQSWSTCSGQSILGDENILLWSTEDSTIRKKENLLSAILMFINSV
ncbi:unnamed protein product [Blepharisma stoltei]|uniref:Uncharacterized protein n=1 Tax=Blepharisma stoltei TaxID=1481888 RepID=A0AAU9ICX9_9CILI|nr:unnamed protein product [Blepharisma stoltei]